MPRNFTVYWRNDTVRSTHVPTINYAASGQLKKAREGDVLWVLSVKEGQLFLVTRLQVHKVVGRAQAVRELRSQIWDADWYAIAQKHEPVLDLDITPIAGDLRFESLRDRLTLHKGKIDAQQIRAMRLLTPESILLLQGFWGPRSKAFGAGSN